MIALHTVLDRRNPLWYGASVALLKAPPLYKAFTWAERVVKERLFGCKMCGQCALPTTAYEISHWKCDALGFRRTVES